VVDGVVYHIRGRWETVGNQERASAVRFDSMELVLPEEEKSPWNMKDAFVSS